VSVPEPFAFQSAAESHGLCSPDLLAVALGLGEVLIRGLKPRLVHYLGVDAIDSQALAAF